MRLIDADALDDLICQLNEEGHEITRNEYKMIDNILFEFPTVCDIDAIRSEIEEKYEKYKYLFDTDFMGTKDLEWVLQIIDRYTKGERE